jgi:serine phosphatase RsbU (regulator of sigma subunit)
MTDSSDQTFVLKPGAFANPEPPAISVGHYLVTGEIEAVRRHRIGPAGLTIGRAPPSELLLASPDVSRRHCRIDVDDEWATVTDLGSANGTFVNGARIAEPTRLSNGAHLRLGATALKYERRDPQEVAAEDYLSHDIQRAVEYARALLPNPIESGPVRAAWYFAPCARLGGDIFGYQFLDETCFTGFLLDVSGHGIGSALHAVAVGSTLRRGALPGADLRDPAAIAAALNTMFPMEDNNGLMLTLWCWSYDAPTRVLRFCCAGHHQALLTVPGQTAPIPLGARNPAIGMLPARQWRAEHGVVPPGSRLYVFSDGAFDLVGADGRQWTQDDIGRIVAQGPAEGLPEPERIYRAVRAAAPGPLQDDFSAVVTVFE